MANFYEVQIIQVKRDMASEYRLLQRKYKQAYEAAASKPVVARWVLRLGESPRNTFRRVAPFNKWSEQDEWNILQILQDRFGEEWQSMQNMASKTIAKHEVFVSALRRDLSRGVEDTPTTEP